MEKHKQFGPHQLQEKTKPSSLQNITNNVIHTIKNGPLYLFSFLDWDHAKLKLSKGLCL